MSHKPMSVLYTFLCGINHKIYRRVVLKLSELPSNVLTMKTPAQEYATQYKLDNGCELCGYNFSAYALQFDHLDPSTKYRTKSGKIVHPSDLFRICSLEVAKAEIAKCRVVCSNCHAVYTHTIQRAE